MAGLNVGCPGHCDNASQLRVHARVRRVSAEGRGQLRGLRRTGSLLGLMLLLRPLCGWFEWRRDDLGEGISWKQRDSQWSGRAWETGERT
jgi:hypothetical protein